MVAPAASTAATAVKEAIVGAPASDTPFSAQTRARFERFASRTNEDGEKEMTVDDYLNATTPPENAPNAGYHKIQRRQFSLLFDVANRRKAARLNFKDYAFIEHLLNKPDAEYEIAFRVFDKDGNGTISLEEMVTVLKENRSPNSLPFDWGSQWVSLYVPGKKTGLEVTYDQFCQLLHGIPGERIRQAFEHFDKDKKGAITIEQFQIIIEQILKHKLSDHVLDNLHTLCSIGLGKTISYANIRAFYNVVNSMDLAEIIVKAACDKSRDGRITKDDFMNEATRLRWGSFTPMEADVLFHFASLDNTTGRLALEDFQKVTDPTWRHPNVKGLSLDNAGDEDHSAWKQVASSAYNFGLGAIAGAFGATAVYPIDLVKTRMQNQRKAVVGHALYLNSIDCFKKVLKNEGPRGLYSGLVPQLVGVAPEKAIKLTVNDLVRGFAEGTGEGGVGISVPWEMVAGGSAGGCQVVFTNPLEIVKIRLQVQGEMAKSASNVPKRSALWIVKNLGVFGLYKGASACLLRDVPFSAIYFPTYAHLKKDLFGEGKDGKKLGVFPLLISGAIAGMPAAYLTTPADVIKTRLQVETRSGETAYKSIRHAASTILKEEGFKAFFKGGPARIVRSSPQFGFTLASYELLKTLLPSPWSPAAAEVKATSQVETLDFIRSRSALKLLLDMDEKFGVPKYRTHIPQQGLETIKKFSSGSGNESS